MQTEMGRLRIADPSADLESLSMIRNRLQRLVFPVVALSSLPLFAGVSLEFVEISSDKISIGDVVEVKGKFQSTQPVDAVVVLSQQQVSFFRKKAGKGSGLDSRQKNEYEFSVKLPTRIKGVPVEAGEHQLRLVVLDENGDKIDNLPLREITVEQEVVEASEGVTELENDFARIEELTRETKLPSYYTKTDRDGSAWLNSDAGRSDVVLLPWTPVQIDGMNISVWNRTYGFGAAGLPETISIAGTGFLQAPIHYVLRVDGKEFRGVYTNRVVEQKEPGTKMIFSACTEDLQVQTEVSVEYDGFCLFKTVLTPQAKNVSVDEFLLEIPVCADQVKHYVHSVLGTFQPQKKDNPDLYILSLGGNGLLADGKKTLPWTPQISLVGPDRGVCVGFLNDRDWHGAEDDMIEVDPTGDSAVIRARLITQKTNLAGPAVYDWYLQALPSRPKLPWDEYTQFHSHQEGDAKSYLSSFDKNAAAMDNAIKAGLKTIIVHQGWTELQGYPGSYDEERNRILHKVVEQAHKRGLKVVLYAGLEVSAAGPEWAEYAKDMLKIPLWAGRPRTEFSAESYRPCSNRFYNDFLVHKLRECIREYDIDGVFLDGHPNMGLCMNPNHGHGYIRDDGRIAGTSYAVEVRDLMKRIYTLFKVESGKDGLVIGHGGLYTPSFSFMDINLVGETEVYAKKINPSLKLSELLPLDYFEAIYNPDTYGVRSLWMSKPFKGGFTFDQNTAVTMQYDVFPRVMYTELDATTPAALEALRVRTMDQDRAHRLWKLMRELDLTDAVHVPFAEMNSYGTVSPSMDPQHVAGMYLWPGKRALIVASNLDAENREFGFRPDFAKLNFNGDVRISDPESREPLDTRDGEIHIDVPAENYRLILLENKN